MKYENNLKFSDEPFSKKKTQVWCIVINVR